MYHHYYCLVDFSYKINLGGVNCRKVKRKQVVHHENADYPARCPVRIYKLYKKNSTSKIRSSSVVQQVLEINQQSYLS